MECIDNELKSSGNEYKKYDHASCSLRVSIIFLENTNQYDTHPVKNISNGFVIRNEHSSILENQNTFVIEGQCNPEMRQ